MPAALKGVRRSGSTPATGFHASGRSRLWNPLCEAPFYASGCKANEAAFKGRAMTKKLDSAIDSIGERVSHICEFLHEIEPDKPVDKKALDSAMHDCSNVSQSMSSLKRVVQKLEEEK